jgi:hypothetical protein
MSAGRFNGDYGMLKQASYPFFDPVENLFNVHYLTIPL